MALINPSNLYSGGNVVLDATPYVRMAMQQRARKQALDEAAAQYFTKLPEKLNTAGVRVQDMEDPNGNGGINSDIQKWQQNWALNKPNIVKGGMAQQQHMADFERIRQKIQQSKDRAKNELLIGKEALKPNGWKPREEDHPVIDAMSKSIYDPASRKGDGVSEYGINDLSLSAAPYDANKQKQFDAAVLNGITPKQNESIAPQYNPITGKVKYTQTYDPKDVLLAADKAAQIVTSDRTLKYKYEDLLHDPESVKIASESLSKLKGAPVIASTPEQMAAGLKANELLSFTKEIEQTDVAAANKYKEKQKQIDYQRSLQKMGYNDQLIRGRMKLGDEYKKTYAKFKSAMDAGEENKVLDTFIDKMAETGKPSAYATYKGQVFRDGKYVQVPIELRDKYTINVSPDPSKPVWESPKNFFLSKDKQNIIPLFYTSEENGKMKLDPSKSIPIPIQNFKLDLSKLLLTKSKTGAEVTDQFTGDENPSIIQSSETGTIEKHPVKKETPKKDPLGIF